MGNPRQQLVFRDAVLIGGPRDGANIRVLFDLRAGTLTTPTLLAVPAGKDAQGVPADTYHAVTFDGYWPDKALQKPVAYFHCSFSAKQVSALYAEHIGVRLDD